MRKAKMRLALVREVDNALQGLETQRMNHEETAACIAEINTGAPEQRNTAWRKLMAAYFILGVAFADRYLWRMPADEVVYFVYRGMLQAVRTYSAGSGSFSNWLVVCIRSESIDRVRHYIVRDKYGTEPVTADTEMITDNAYDVLPGPRVNCVLAEIDAALACAVKELPERLRRVIRETVMGDTTGVALAKEFGVTRARVGQYKQMALARLRRNRHVRRVVADGDGVGILSRFCEHE